MFYGEDYSQVKSIEDDHQLLQERTSQQIYPTVGSCDTHLFRRAARRKAFSSKAKMVAQLTVIKTLLGQTTYLLERCPTGGWDQSGVVWGFFMPRGHMVKTKDGILAETP